jgi:hypothetical protein
LDLQFLAVGLQELGRHMKPVLVRDLSANQIAHNTVP